jgi:hypothetical protein
MGTLNGGDGDNRPPDGGGVPGLPPEWGPIFVPDDPAELAEEAAQVRRELRREVRQRSRRRLPWPFGHRSPGSAVELAMVLIGIAILATLTSLFALTWPQTPRFTPSTNEAARTVPPPAPRAVPALDLLDASGTAAPLRGLLPAVILMVEDCACADLITATDVAAPPEINVLVVAATPPPLSEGVSPRVRALGDPAGGLRSLAPTPLRGTAAVLLVARNADIVHTVPAASSIAPYQTDLAELANR